MRVGTRRLRPIKHETANSNGVRAPNVLDFEPASPLGGQGSQSAPIGALDLVPADVTGNSLASTDGGTSSGRLGGNAGSTRTRVQARAFSWRPARISPRVQRGRLPKVG